MAERVVRGPPSEGGSTGSGRRDPSAPSLDVVAHQGAAPAEPGRRGAVADEACGRFEIRIGRDGTWYYHGSPIGRKPLVKLFSRVLRKVGDEYWLVTPAERGRIEVDDAPFVAVAMAVAGEGCRRQFTFTTNLDEDVVAGPEHPIRVAVDPASGEPSPYIEVRQGLDALIARAVFYDLVEFAEEIEVDGRRAFGVWSSGVFFALE